MIEVSDFAERLSKFTFGFGNVEAKTEEAANSMQRTASSKPQVENSAMRPAAQGMLLPSRTQPQMSRVQPNASPLPFQPVTQVVVPQAGSSLGPLPPQVIKSGLGQM